MTLVGIMICWLPIPIHKKEQTPVYYLKNDLDMEDLAGIRQLLFT